MADVRHVLKAQQFNPELIGSLFERVDWMNQRLQARKLETANILRDRLMYSLFYEASTRTRFSFETAGQRLGMRIVGSENAGELSSRSKGESDLDAFRVLASYDPDVIVTRQDRADELTMITEELNSAGYDVPIINAGDGGGQHPTQALMDMYTIQAELGRLNNLHIVMVGDLKNGRTARSLAYLLAMYAGNRITFVAPNELQMLEDITKHLEINAVPCISSEDLHASLRDADVVYDTRIQAERGMDQASYDQVAGRYRLTLKEMQLLPKHAKVLHPLPRVQDGTKQKVKLADGSVAEVSLLNELAPECDSDPRAAYFRQAGYGLPVRMALLEWVVRG